MNKEMYTVNLTNRGNYFFEMYGGEVALEISEKLLGEKLNSFKLDSDVRLTFTEEDVIKDERLKKIFHENNDLCITLGSKLLKPSDFKWKLIKGTKDYFYIVDERYTDSKGILNLITQRAIELLDEKKIIIKNGIFDYNMNLYGNIEKFCTKEIIDKYNIMYDYELVIEGMFDDYITDWELKNFLYRNNIEGFEKEVVSLDKGIVYHFTTEEVYNNKRLMRIFQYGKTVNIVSPVLMDINLFNWEIRKGDIKVRYQNKHDLDIIVKIMWDKIKSLIVKDEQLMINDKKRIVRKDYPNEYTFEYTSILFQKEIEEIYRSTDIAIRRR